MSLLEHKSNVLSISAKVTIIISFLLLNFFAASQVNPDPYYFDQYRLAEGFNAKSCRDVVQDKNGYMYFTTENGLVRYNGHQFKYYREDKRNPKALQASYCVFMEKDSEDKIWLMAGPELQIFNPLTETFELLRKQSNDTSYSYQPFSLRYDVKRKRMWIACADGLYYCNDGKRNLIQISNKDSLYDDYLRDLYIYNDKIYGANDSGLYIYDIQKEKPIFHNLKENTLGGEYLSGFELYIKDEKNIFISTWNKGIILYDAVNRSHREFPFSNPKNEHNGIVSLHKDKSGNKLWVGSLHGLYSFDLATHQYTSYRTEDVASHYGIRGAVNNFSYDDQGGLWICGGEGLFRLDFNKQFVSKHDISFLKNKSGDYPPSAFSFEHNSNNKDSVLWVQLYYRELYRYNFMHKKQMPLPIKMAEYGKRNGIGIFNLIIDRRNRLWYMTNEHGLIVYDISKDVFIVPPKTQFIQKNSWVVNIYEKRNGDILICTYDGLYKMSNDNKISEFVELNKFLRSKDFRYIRTADEDSKGNIILARASDSHSIEANVVKYNPNTHTINVLSKKDCPAFDKITKMESMIVNERDQIFVGSYNGVAIVNTDLDCNSVKYYNTENGLTNESVYNFEESYNGRVWYNHEFGLTQYIPQSDYHQHITYYNSPLSLSRAFTTKSPNTNILYTGVNKGFELIDINKIQDQKASKLTLCDFSIDNKSIRYRGGDIILSYKDFPVRIEVSLLQYTNSTKNSYSYSINGGKQYPCVGNILKFDKLAPGTYRVNISGKNFYGNEAKLDEIVMKVLPPFYQTWWFILSSVLLFTFTVMYYFHLRDKHRQKLIAIRDGISKDLHDDLGSNLSYIKMMSELEIKRRNQSDTTAFKTIADEIKVVMDSMSDIVWLTQPQYDHIDEIINRLKKISNELLESKNISTIWNVAELKSINLDVSKRKQLYLAIKEIIHNCSKYSEATQVNFTFKIMINKLLIDIVDDGKGFEIENVQYGNGINNIKSRILDCGGHVNIITKPDHGVSYHISIPLS